MTISKEIKAESEQIFPLKVAGNTNPSVEVYSLGTSVSVAPITERDQSVEM